VKSTPAQLVETPLTDASANRPTLCPSNAVSSRDRLFALTAVFALVVALEATLFGAMAPAHDGAFERGAHAEQSQGDHTGLSSREADALVTVAAVFTALAGIAFPFFLRTLDDDRPPTSMGRRRPSAAALVRSASGVLALLSTSAALIHFAVLPEHFQEHALFGVLFALTALLQLAWSALVVRRPSRRLLQAGAVGNLGVAVVWLLSRTTGLPLGPEPWVPETVGVADSLATAFEVLIVIGATVLLYPRAARVRLDPRIAAVGPWTLAAFLIPLTSVALLAAVGAAF
jgi:hypothetical protein